MRDRRDREKRKDGVIEGEWRRGRRDGRREERDEKRDRGEERGMEMEGVRGRCEGRGEGWDEEEGRGDFLFSTTLRCYFFVADWKQL